jgi:dTDP-4-dehydrorhamnose reductase
VIRILITGSNGQVGWELQRALCPLGEVIAVDRKRMDLASPDAIRETIRSVKPGIIVNAAAYTAVDKAESEPELAMAINGIAPGIIAEEARRLECFLIHYSTDYVFDGTKDVAYLEADTPKPLSAYGRSKLAGELAIQSAGVPHYIFRTSWIYSNRGHNFLRTILRLARERDELRVVDDQMGAPTWARALAESTALALAQALTAQGLRLAHLNETSGLYHVTAQGRVSWYGFAKAILDGAASGKAITLLPIATSAYPLPARRPANSSLSNSKFANTFGFALPAWGTTLRLCLEKGAEPSPCEC